MKGSLRYILACVVLASVLLSSCKKEEDRIIPRSKMARIYAEMMLTDQWLQMEPDARRLTDTTLVYEPILEKYGYDSEIYRRSVYKYLDDPERFARIFRETGEILDKRLEELNKMKGIQDEARKREEEREKFNPDFKVSEHFPFMFDEPYVHYYDSLSVEVDSATLEYRFRNIELSDTLYEGIEMIIKIDSTAVLDSIARADSLAVADSLARVDSLAKADSVKKRLPKKTPVPQKQIARKDIRQAAGMELINEQKKKRTDE